MTAATSMTAPSLKIRIYGDPCLRTKSVPVKSVGVSERVLIKAMLETMYASKGIGLAAPQIGINQQIFVADIGDGPVAIINPKVVRRSGSQIREEGCLSIPGVVVEIKRPQKIWVSYHNEQNHLVERELEDLMARVFLHENDHLHGKLIIDYVGWGAKTKVKKQLQEILKTHPLE